MSDERLILLKDFGICARCGTASRLEHLTLDDGFHWCIDWDLCRERRTLKGEMLQAFRQELTKP